MGTRHGILIKGGAHLEALAQVKAFAFDKTGTLTAGKPVVVDSRTDACESDNGCEYCDDVLALAAAVEQRSTHPLAQAVVQAAEARGVASVYAAAEDVAILPGKGVQGRVDSRFITIGSHRLFDDEYAHSERLHELAIDAEAQGQTTMLLRDEDRVLGYIAFKDAIREESKAAVAAVKALGATTIMLTGDHQRVAETVGVDVGVDMVKAGLLPEDKVAAVKDLLGQHGQVAMVGDGVNDAPALATATVGIAMGDVGSAQAMETADLVLVGDDLRQLPFAIRLARFARGIIGQNVMLSLGVKVLFMVLALMGAATLWMAILADVGMSLLVTLNGMRPLRFS
jgi:Cd2+/Zn2+-exporting ATPase